MLFENEKLLSVLINSQLQDQEGNIWWIGLDELSGFWTWIDGTAVDFTYWSPGEPKSVSTFKDNPKV